MTPPPPPSGTGGSSGTGGINGTGSSNGTGGSNGSGGSNSGCPGDWKLYTELNGATMCTPPPTNGGCPVGYWITIQNNQQYCTPVVIR